MSITLKKKPVIYQYAISDYPSNRVPTQRDLGIVIHNKLNFVSHVDFIVKKANRVIGLVWHNFRHGKSEHVHCTAPSSDLKLNIVQ